MTARWGLLLVGMAGCASPEYERVEIAPCTPADGTLEVWCAAEDVCEYRLGDEVVASCASALECRRGRSDALEACAARDYCEPTAEVDLLLVIDDSNSMDAEQAQLLAALPLMIERLADSSIHVGVVSTDLGAGPVPAGESVPTCDPGFGDDGILHRTATAAGCSPTYPSWVFEYSGRGDTSTLLDAVGCVASLGTGGCGFEQQLEAGLKAVSPAAGGLTFAEGSVGHGDGENAGFLRPHSVLAMLVLTDEDDCSRPDQRLVYGNEPAYAGVNLNLRCTHFPDELFPIERYVDGLLRLRQHEHRVVFGAIAGMPDDLAGASYEDVLADPRMRIVEHPVPGPSLDLACSSPSGTAYPARRIVEVARGLRDRGAGSSISSICAADYEAGLSALTDEIVAAQGCEP